MEPHPAGNLISLKPNIVLINISGEWVNLYQISNLLSAFWSLWRRIYIVAAQKQMPLKHTWVYTGPRTGRTLSFNRKILNSSWKAVKVLGNGEKKHLLLFRFSKTHLSLCLWSLPSVYLSSLVFLNCSLTQAKMKH